MDWHIRIYPEGRDNVFILFKAEARVKTRHLNHPCPYKFKSKSLIKEPGSRGWILSVSITEADQLDDNRKSQLIWGRMCTFFAVSFVGFIVDYWAYRLLDLLWIIGQSRLLDLLWTIALINRGIKKLRTCTCVNKEENSVWWTPVFSLQFIGNWGYESTFHLNLS